MHHPSGDDLVLYHYGEAGDAERIASHLAACVACRASHQQLQRTLAAVETLVVPEPDEGFESRMWQRVKPGLALRARHDWLALFRPARLAFAGTMAVLVVAAFLAGRYWPRPEPTATPAATPAVASASVAGGERVLLVAIVEHLERSHRALTELVNVEPAASMDISAEQGWVRDLVPANRLYRQTASDVGETGLASLLDDLERVLVEIVHSPSTLSSDEFDQIRQRIESQGIIFKVRVLGSDVRERQQAAAFGPARRRS